MQLGNHYEVYYSFLFRNIGCMAFFTEITFLLLGLTPRVAQMKNACLRGYSAPLKSFAQ